MSSQQQHQQLSTKIQSLSNSVLKTLEFRDHSNPTKAALEVGSLLEQTWIQSDDSLVDLMHQIILKITTFPEHATTSFTNNIRRALARAQVAQRHNELPILSLIISRSYYFNPSSRVEIKQLIGNVLEKADLSFTNLFSSTPINTKPTPALVKVCLSVLYHILEMPGRKNPIPVKDLKDLLVKILLPLHSTQGKFSPTESVFGFFHEELMLCMKEICILGGSLSKTNLAEEVILGVLAKYPAMQEGNSPKEVLFLHELEYLVINTPQLTTTSRAAIVGRLVTCVTSLNASVCERALAFWKSDDVFNKLQGSDKLLTKQCSTALARTSLDHWSATVKKMAGAALSKSSSSAGTATTSATSTNETSIINQALTSHKKLLEQQQQSSNTNTNNKEEIPLPKTFSSTTVIRDAIEPFAEGAFGRIWKGRAIIAGRGKSDWPMVALKEMNDVDMAQRELIAMQRIGEHPNLLSLLGVFPMKTGSCLVLEFVEGGDLHTAVVERGSLAVDIAKFIIGEVGAALQHVHGKGFAFGDVKPENVLLTSVGHVKLCDFGSVWKVDQDDSSNSRDKTVNQWAGGTVEYLSPEQSPSFASDWWALGCVLHFMLTGKPPVFFNEGEGEGDLSTGYKRAVTFADNVGSSASSLAGLKDVAARAVVAALCAKDPTKRPKDGGESLPFFDTIRPWNKLYQKTPPAIIQGTVGKETGPWTRRTFSVLISPLPLEFKNFSVESWKMLTQVKDGSEGDKGFVGLQGLELNMDDFKNIPVDRINSTNQAVVRNPGHKGGNSSMKQNYQVAGVDLTAG
jgi:serine/threonine protein kinase